MLNIICSVLKEKKQITPFIVPPVHLRLAICLALTIIPFLLPAVKALKLLVYLTKFLFKKPFKASIQQILQRTVSALARGVLLTLDRAVPLVLLLDSKPYSSHHLHKWTQSQEHFKSAF